MKGRPVEDLVFEHLLPERKETDPPTFQTFLRCNIIPEIHAEAAAFYGDVDTQEAKYPGLDYMHPTHRIRLSRWPWHRRLFRAFDALRLTESEIRGLTRWEGTKWAKEKYEKEKGVVIRDSTLDEISDWTAPLPSAPTSTSASTFVSTSVSTSASASASASTSEEPRRNAPSTTTRRPTDMEREYLEREQSILRTLRNLGERLARDDEEVDRPDREDGESSSDDDPFESVGVELNERLRERALRREAGDMSVVMDEEWEHWLKNALESGELPLLAEQLTDILFLHVPSTAVIPFSFIPPGMLRAARNGQWSEIPRVLHPMLRRRLETPTSIRGSSHGTRLDIRRRVLRRDSAGTRVSSVSQGLRPTIRLPSAQGAF
ncbi:hypothetical protein E4U24_002046 [Claviceps purpurea]|nr:hypothetical protein E4U24_002046 [Claviceps purpurea]KAG6281022.1 hypothetical protein E4U48_007499 [Claviceps purpurea]